MAPVSHLLQDKVVLVEVCRDFPLRGNGAAVGSETYRYLWFDIPEIEALGPYTASIICHTKMALKTSGMSWNVGLSWSLDGKRWTTPVQLVGSDIATNGQDVQAAFTNTDELGVHIRIALAVPNAVAATEAASVSLTLAFVLRS